MKKVLSLILVAIMLMTVMPVTTFAANWLCEITGHDFEWQVTKAATCKTTGTETEICTRSDCGTTRNTRTINLTSHTVTTIPAKAPTCDKDGYTAGKACLVCGYIIEACQTIEKKGHVAVDVPAVDATCTENGKTAGKECSVCGVVITNPGVIPALGHKVNWTVTKESTCTEKGKQSAYCSACKKTVTEDIPALGHTDVDFDGKCDRCGATNELPQPEDPADSCTCNCHKSGISGFIWKILCFFYKLFRTNGTCSCGAAHY